MTEDSPVSLSHIAARSLFRLIDAEKDLGRVRLLNDLALVLQERADESTRGAFLELQLWSGLLLDTPDMGREYRRGILEAFPWLDGQGTQ